MIYVNCKSDLHFFFLFIVRRFFQFTFAFFTSVNSLALWPETTLTQKTSYPMTKSECEMQVIALKDLTRTSRQLKPKLKPQNHAKVAKLKVS
jgi:hypothetical protein